MSICSQLIGTPFDAEKWCRALLLDADKKANALYGNSISNVVFEDKLELLTKEIEKIKVYSYSLCDRLDNLFDRVEGFKVIFEELGSSPNKIEITKDSELDDFTITLRAQKEDLVPWEASLNLFEPPKFRGCSKGYGCSPEEALLNLKDAFVCLKDHVQRQEDDRHV